MTIDKNELKEATRFFKFHKFDRNVNEFVTSPQFEGLVHNNFDKLTNHITCIVNRSPSDLPKRSRYAHLLTHETDSSDSHINCKNYTEYSYPTYTKYRRKVISLFKIQLFEKVFSLSQLVRKEVTGTFYSEILGIKDTYQRNLEDVESICHTVSEQIEETFFKEFYYGYFPSPSEVPTELSNIFKNVFGTKSLIPVEAIPAILTKFEEQKR